MKIVVINGMTPEEVKKILESQGIELFDVTALFEDEDLGREAPFPLGEEGVERPLEEPPKTVR